VIAVNTDSDSLIVCNGYKDESYIELALLAQKMLFYHRTHLVDLNGIDDKILGFIPVLFGSLLKTGRHGKKFNLGLEAGSKPELHAVIAVNTDSDSLIVCPGFQSEIEFLSVADNLFYHRTHLVDLNGIDDKIPKDGQTYLPRSREDERTETDSQNGEAVECAAQYRIWK